MPEKEPQNREAEAAEPASIWFVIFGVLAVSVLWMSRSSRKIIAITFAVIAAIITGLLFS